MKKTFLNLLLIIFTGATVFAQSCNNEKKLAQFAVSEKEPEKDCIELSLPSLEEQNKIAAQIHAAQKTKAIDSVFRQRIKQGFNGTILVEQKGVLLYKNYSGVGNLKTGECITPHSTFQLASISKTFTGIAILQLAEEGKLKLTDTIQTYIPNFPYKNITIENLLSHRSGLPNYLHCFENKHRRNTEIPDNKTIIDWFSSSKPIPPPQRLPNKRFSYNNSNFIVLARIIEIVTKKNFAHYMRDRIFLPLKMHSTYIDTIVPDSILQTKTCGYDGRRLRVRDFYDGVYGDKGIFSNTEDLLKWYHALRSGCLLKKEFLDEAYKPRSLEKKSRHNYGLGFRLMTNLHNMNNVHYVYHAGWWNGYSNMFWMEPKNDYVIIILSNKRNHISYDLKPLISILEEGSAEDYDEKLNQ